jgi:hypothetical protein
MLEQTNITIRNETFNICYNIARCPVVTLTGAYTLFRNLYLMSKLGIEKLHSRHKHY